MISYGKLLTLLTLLTIDNSLRGVISFALFKSPSGKPVLILGDWHENAAERFEIDNIGHMKNVIDLIKKVIVRKKVRVLAEEICPLTDQSVHQDFAPCFRLLQEAWGKENTDVSLEFYDPRGYSAQLIEQTGYKIIDLIITPNSRLLTGLALMRQIMGLRNMQLERESEAGVERDGNLLKKPTTEAATSANLCGRDGLRGLPVDVSGWRKPLEMRIEKFSEGRHLFSAGQKVKDLLCDFAHQNAQLEALVAKYSTNEMVREAIARWYSRYLKSFDAIQADLSQEDPEEIISISFFKRFIGQPTLGDFLTYFESFWDSSYKIDGNYLFYEMMLIDRILSEATTDPLVLYVGDAHAKSVSEKLAELTGWTQLSMMRLIKNENFYTNIPNNDPFFRDKLLEVVDQALTPLYYECTYCSRKKGITKSCGWCKKDRYCDQACQAGAWPHHKMVCVKPLIKV
jgi:hypothetical protein